MPAISLRSGRGTGQLHSDLAIGDPVFGGFVGGVIDTTRPGSILATDAFQTGARYLLIVAPKSLETYGPKWRTSGGYGPTGVQTIWNGLGATTAMYNESPTIYPAANYCYSLAFPNDGGSRWYLPAKDEIEMIYRNLKPTTQANYLGTNSNTAPSFPYNGVPYSTGVTPSTDPTGTAYTTNNPTQTKVSAFKAGGWQAFTSTQGTYYYSSTEDNYIDVWTETFYNGYVAEQAKTGDYLYIRPVRRILL